MSSQHSIMKKAGVVLAALILVGLVSGAAYAQATGSPEFEVYASENVVEPGEETTVPITFENEGQVTEEGDEAEEAAVTEARGVTAELDSGDAPISVDSGEAQIGSVPQEQTTTESFDVTVDGDATPGTYELPVEFTYTYTPEVDGDEEADEVTETTTETVEIEIDESSRFEIESATSDANVGDSGDSTLDITNTGPDDASEAVVTLSAPDGTLDIPSQSTDIYIGDWDAGETQAIDFTTELSDDALAQEYTIEATVDYVDESGNDQTSPALRTGLPTGEQQDFSVNNVQSDLWVGEDGAVTAEITNEGPNQADNVVLLLEDGGDEQLDILGDLGGEGPSVGLGENVESQETQYAVGNLDAGESAQFEFPLAVSSEADAGPREAEVTTRYRTPAGDVQTSDPFDMSVEIADERDIFTVGSSDLDADVETDDTVVDDEEEAGEATFESGETDTMAIEVTNDYDQTLTNVRAQTFTDDPLSIDDDEVFIPEIEPGETEVLQFDLEVEEEADPQSYPVEIDFQYDDEDDTDQLSDTYQVPVTVGEPADDGLLWVTVIVVGLIVLLAALAWWFRDDIREQYDSLRDQDDLQEEDSATQDTSQEENSTEQE